MTRTEVPGPVVVVVQVPGRPGLDALVAPGAVDVAGADERGPPLSLDLVVAAVLTLTSGAALLVPLSLSLLCAGRAPRLSVLGETPAV